MQASYYLDKAGIDYTSRGSPGRHRRGTDRTAPAAHATDPGGIEIGRLQRLIMRLTLGRNAPA